MSVKPPRNDEHLKAPAMMLATSSLFNTNQAAGRIKTVQEALQAKAKPNTP